MRVVFANCAVTYSGRGDTKLATHDQMILIKDDGSVSVNGYSKVKPLNYMGPKSAFAEYVDDNGVLTWTFDSSKENLTIKLFAIHSEMYYNLREDGPGLVRDGTESQLQEHLAQNITLLGSDLQFTQREFPTVAGPVDLLARNSVTDEPVVIEVKRVAMSAAVYQLKRYLDAFEEEYGQTPKGVIAALNIRPKTLALAEKKGIECVTVSF